MRVSLSSSLSLRLSLMLLLLVGRQRPVGGWAGGCCAGAVVWVCVCVCVGRRAGGHWSSWAGSRFTLARICRSQQTAHPAAQATPSRCGAMPPPDAGGWRVTGVGGGVHGPFDQATAGQCHSSSGTVWQGSLSAGNAAQPLQPAASPYCCRKGAPPCNLNTTARAGLPPVIKFLDLNPMLGYTSGTTHFRRDTTITHRYRQRLAEHKPHTASTTSEADCQTGTGVLVYCCR